MRIHLVIEDDRGETFRIEKKDDGYSILYNPITDYSEELLSYDELIKRINLALSLGFNIEIANTDIDETTKFTNYNISKVTPYLLKEIMKNLETHNVSIRRGDG